MNVLNTTETLQWLLTSLRISEFLPQPLENPDGLCLIVTLTSAHGPLFRCTSAPTRVPRQAPPRLCVHGFHSRLLRPSV